MEVNAHEGFGSRTAEGVLRQGNGGLEEMQALVGGYIQAVYPFEDPVAVVCNEEGKNLCLPFNRPLLDEHGLPYDIICGTFFVAGLGAEDFASLTDEQVQKYKAIFDSVMVISAPKKEKNTPQRRTTHER